MPYAHIICLLRTIVANAHIIDFWAAELPTHFTDYRLGFRMPLRTHTLGAERQRTHTLETWQNANAHTRWAQNANAHVHSMGAERKTHYTTLPERERRQRLFTHRWAQNANSLHTRWRLQDFLYAHITLGAERQRTHTLGSVTPTHTHAGNQNANRTSTRWAQNSQRTHTLRRNQNAIRKHNNAGRRTIKSAHTRKEVRM